MKTNKELIYDFWHNIFTILLLIYFLYNIATSFVRYRIDTDLLKIFYTSIFNGFIFYNLEYSTTFSTEHGSYCFEYKDDNFDIKNFSKYFEKTKEEPNSINCGIYDLYLDITNCEKTEKESYIFYENDKYFQYEINLTRCENRILFTYNYRSFE